MRMQKKTIKRKEELLECNKFKKRMKKKKLKEDMLTSINPDELLSNSCRKVEMLIKVAWFVLNGVQLF